MSSRLTRSDVLRNLLQVLVDGWGYRAVVASLESIGPSAKKGRTNAPARQRVKVEKGAVRIVEGEVLPPQRKRLLLGLATAFDEGRAFPKLNDVRTFLMAHHQNANDLKTRPQAFRRMLPVLTGMSDKGLEKVISRSHHSGPAELEPISNAIRGAGEDLRGLDRDRSSTGRETSDLFPGAPRPRNSDGSN